MWTSFILLAVIITLGNGWQGYGRDDLVWLVLSGFIGLFVGDTLLFASVNVIGPRRASILFATNATMAVGLAVLLSVRIGLGVLAALAQAMGSLAVKPALVNGVDPMLAAAIRLGCAALCHSLFRLVQPTMTKCHERLSLRDLGWVGLSSFNAMALGMKLLMFALANGDVGWWSVLSSTAPIMTLPMLWTFFRQAPPAGA